MKLTKYLLLSLILFVGQSSLKVHGFIPGDGKLPEVLEQSLFDYIVDAWYPRSIDTVYGGFIPDFEYNWEMTEGPQNKALVQQSRHLWTLSFLFKHYPERVDFLDYARQGYEFIKENYQDKKYGGLYTLCSREGNALSESLSYKRTYGHAFAIYGLSGFYSVSGDSSALEMAINTFLWLDSTAHDKEYGGYFESLRRDGTPHTLEEANSGIPGYLPLTGLKEFNSSIHVLEAFTLLYEVWKDDLLHKRLEEIFLLFRDVIIHPDGYLQLYFYPDWTLVPEETMDSISGGNEWFTQHISFGHDVETAFLMLEAAKVLGLENDEKTQRLAKKLVDHSLSTGWDHDNGGFYYIAFKENDGVRIFDPHKAWWTEAEGLNALMMMEQKYPGEGYREKFIDLWNYSDEYLIDKKYGGWYNYGLDNFPENRYHKKAHNWKASYHNVRAMLRCIEMLYLF